MAEPSQSPRMGDELAAFLESDLISHLATRNAQLRPATTHAAGFKVSEDRRGFTVFVPQAVAARHLRNLEDNGQLAVVLNRVLDNRSVQVKGTMERVRPLTEAERQYQQAYILGLIERLGEIGLPRSVSRGFALTPSLAIDARVSDVFIQTPGPQAGQRAEL